MPGDTFVDTVASHPETALALLRKLALVVRSSDQRISELSFLTAEQRISLMLLRLAIPDGVAPGSLSVSPSPTLEFLASNVGVTRETVARAFSRLSKAGLIERVGKTIHILDSRGLENLFSFASPD